MAGIWPRGKLSTANRACVFTLTTFPANPCSGVIITAGTLLNTGFVADGVFSRDAQPRHMPETRSPIEKSLRTGAVKHLHTTGQLTFDTVERTCRLSPLEKP